MFNDVISMVDITEPQYFSTPFTTSVSPLTPALLPLLLPPASILPPPQGLYPYDNQIATGHGNASYYYPASGYPVKFIQYSTIASEWDVAPNDQMTFVPSFTGFNLNDSHTVAVNDPDTFDNVVNSFINLDAFAEAHGNQNTIH